MTTKTTAKPISDKMEKLTLEKFEEASELVKNVTLPTKLEYSESLSSRTGGKIYLKPENMQYTGAYKVRGAYYKIATLSDEQRSKGLITASAGNHAQGVAYAAKKIRMQGHHRNADCNAAHKDQPHQSIRRRNNTLRRCVRRFLRICGKTCRRKGNDLHTSLSMILR